MATRAPRPAYEAGAKWIESLMIDSCIVSRAPLQQFTGTLDLNTGLRVVRSEDAPETIYMGDCMFDRGKGDERAQELGGELLNLVLYKVFFPRSVDNLRLRDEITVTKSREPILVGHRLRVLDVLGSTHTVYRACFAQDMTTERSLYAED